MTHLHTNDVDIAAIVSPAQEQPSRHLVAPAVTTTPCRCCPAVIHHVGDLVVPFCDTCLDVLSGDVEVRVSRRRRVEVEADGESEGAYRLDAAWQMLRRELAHELDDVDDIVTPAPQRLRDEIFSRAPAEAERSSEATPRSVADVDSKVLCATCVNMTTHACKCGKLCCYECCDDVGRCPGCDGEER